jgi:group I intron endonuclease
MIIYKTTNILDGRIYIGIDFYNNPEYLGSGKLLKLAIKKHGVKNFKKQIVKHCISRYHLSEAERFWIKYFNSTDRQIGYNLSNGGYGGHTGSEAYKKISDWNKGRKMPQIAIDNQIKTKSLWSEEKKKSILLKFKNTLASQSDEKKKLKFERMSASKKGCIPWNKGTAKPKIKKERIAHNRRKVAQFSIDGKFIRQFNTVTEACILLNGSRSNINKVALGKSKHHLGFLWKYL